ncbi:MAG TPA: permease prefix domain 1-containing protein [Candidatus Acidoferrum sp.]|nr:permease prefix domain 1-containing protein [Candidatus Acidoferrum sp.]
MPDWNALVREHLAGLSLEAEERREVIAELAAHLEETFEELCQQGLAEEAAVRRTLSQVKDWQDLRRKIQTARKRENIMSNRVRQFWLPGFATLFLSTILLALTQIYGPKPWILSLSHPPVLLIYIPWLFCLPFVGAVGAYLSHRAGGSARTIFLSTIFSALPFLASIVVIFPVSLIFDRFIAHNIAPMALVLALFGWVLIPVVALLAGGLPVQLLVLRGLGSRRVVGR